jgi:hypothetical protein
VLIVDMNHVIGIVWYSNFLGLLKQGFIYLWNHIEWYICYVTNIEGINLSLFLWRDVSWWSNLFLTSFSNWYKCNSINNNWLNISNFDWNIMETVDFYNWVWRSNMFFFRFEMSTLIWLYDFRLRYFRFSNDFCFEFGSEFFRNHRDWDVSDISFHKWVNMSFFQRQYWISSSNLSLCSFSNWNVSLAIEYNWFWLLRNWNVMLSIDLNNRMSNNFYWNVMDAINNNHFSIFDTLILFSFDFNCFYFV